MRPLLLILIAVLLSLFTVFTLLDNAGKGGGKPGEPASAVVPSGSAAATEPVPTETAARSGADAPSQNRSGETSVPVTSSASSAEAPSQSASLTSASTSPAVTAPATQNNTEEGGMVYSNSPYYDAAHEERYAAYAAQHPKLGAEKIVIYVEMNLDHAFYTQVSPSVDPNSLTVLCNKYNALPDDYAPQLVDIPAGYYVEDGKTYKLRFEALDAFVRMADAARAEGYTLKVISAYRSRDFQQYLYNKYVDLYGAAAADTSSARPRHSEHETGLAVDINSVETKFENTREFQWLQKNAFKYGFIMRYPSESQWITGYIYEPWHYRYLGPELAEKVRASGLTYDEFYLRRGEF